MKDNATLKILNQFQDFIDNIAVIADMGCGKGDDAWWWANLTKDDGTARNIQVNAVDNKFQWQALLRHDNIHYIEKDFSSSGLEPNSQDFLWAHNSLQYSIRPIDTLLHWWEIMKPEAMLLVTVPYNYTVDNHREFLKVNTTYHNGCFFNYTLGNLIMMLAATGFDCRSSHFRFDRAEKTIQAAVYKLSTNPNPNIDWYEMCEKELLPICLEQSLMQKGKFDDTDLVVEWIDRTQYMLSI